MQHSRDTLQFKTFSVVLVVSLPACLPSMFPLHLVPLHQNSYFHGCRVFLISLHGQPVQRAITSYLFRRTHSAVYGRIKPDCRKDLWEKETFLLLQSKITQIWKSLKQPAVTWWLKDVKGTLQQIKCNARGKKNCLLRICSGLI